MKNTKQLAILCIIALSLGIIGGYIIGLVIYRPQLLSLQAEVEKLKTDIERLKGLGKGWHIIAYFEATMSGIIDENGTFYESKLTPKFFIKGDKWRIAWHIPSMAMYRYPTFAGFIVYDEEGNMIDVFEFQEATELIATGAQGIYYISQGRGYFYLEIGFGIRPLIIRIESYH